MEGVIEKEDITLQPEALGLTTWYPDGTFSTVSATNNTVSTTKKEAKVWQTGENISMDDTDRSDSTTILSGQPINDTQWQSDMTIQNHLEAITLRLHQMGLGSGVMVSLNIQMGIHTSDRE